ncbi:RNA polymerase subunit sigma-70 [Catellatospora bangladeshensis]|uniref:RNA polymerase subunit sigma-70 n=1 Tax=Catellatospora bangladeshensis TaxID=310355 RepID=UPI00361BC4F7
MLPDARLGARRRRRPAGRAGARLARAAPVRGAQLAARLALHRGHPDLPRRHRGARAPGAAGRPRPVQRALGARRHATQRHRLAGAVPRRRAARRAAGPGARYEQREAVELAFVAALQHLPGNQRAALLLFEVLGFTVAEIAAMMDTSVTSVNSALARARRIVAEKVPARSQQQTLRKIGDARVRRLVDGYAAALESGDADALVALLTEDVTWSMPPLPHWYRGLAAVTDFAVAQPLSTCGEWRHRAVTANGQPAVACYLRPFDTDGPYEAWSICVLTLRDDHVAEITSFLGPEHFLLLDLPTALP